MRLATDNMKSKNCNLSSFASQDGDAKRFYTEEKDFRTDYYHDVDKVLYSLSYIRYMDKTQVFTNKGHDHLTKRMLHVQLVSKISRTISRALNLNEDLTEAAALGHDLGHVPLGHVGEKFLNELSLKFNEGYFKHNVQSVRLLMNVENYGKGLNMCYQVLDAILCHNGESLEKIYTPKNKSIDEFLDDYNNSYTQKNIKLIPGTLEACVLRVSDVIGYIARDLEDAYRLKLITKEDVPETITDILGSTTSEIVKTIIYDIVNNSINQNYIKLSDNVFNAINELKTFNYKNIYYKSYSSEELKEYENMFEIVFNSLLVELDNNNDSPIIKSYLNNLSEEYSNNKHSRIVIDYIAGMTDDYFIKTYKRIIKK